MTNFFLSFHKDYLDVLKIKAKFNPIEFLQIQKLILPGQTNKLNQFIKFLLSLIKILQLIIKYKLLFFEKYYSRNTNVMIFNPNKYFYMNISTENKI